VLYPLEAGQPILERDLADRGIGAGLASRIPDGKRALALRSDDVVGVAGFLAPGSRVDVLVTFRLASSAEPWTATVLENAEVLAAGQRTEPDPTGKPASATVLTLLVSPLEAERAVLASTQGTVHFVLRNGLDKEDSDSAPISLAWLAAGPHPGFAGIAGEQTSLIKTTIYRRHATIRPRLQVETVLGEQSDQHVRNPGDASEANGRP
jgi:pilus assembly protein CpaB